MSAIPSFNSTSAPPSTGDAFSTLTSGQFLQIIFTELQNQDPLAPNDTSAMLDQLATLRSIESDTQITGSLQRLVTQSEFASASLLIGSLVSGITLDNRRVSDLVISVSMTQDGPVLNMFDGSRMFFRNVDEIVGPIDDLVDPPVDDDQNDDGDIDGDGDIGDDNNNGTTNDPLGSGVIDANDATIGGGIIPGSSIDRPVHPTVSSDV